MRLFRDQGTQVAMGRSVIPILQGRCVGGTTVVNGAIVWRLPEDAYDACFGAIGARERHPARRARGAHGPHRARSLRRPRARSPPRRQRHAHEGRRGEARLEGARDPAQRRSTARAAAGASRRAPRSASRAWSGRTCRAPRSLGARVLADHEVRVIETSAARAVAVSGRRRRRLAVPHRRAPRRRPRRERHPVAVHPAAARASARAQHVGAHFRAHPGTAVAGVYRDPVRHLGGRHAVLRGRRVPRPGLQDGGRRPAGGARGRAPARAWARASSARCADFPNMAVWGVQVRAEAEGSVAPAGDRARITYTPYARRHGDVPPRACDASARCTSRRARSASTRACTAGRRC